MRKWLCLLLPAGEKVAPKGSDEGALLTRYTVCRASPSSALAGIFSPGGEKRNLQIGIGYWR